MNKQNLSDGSLATILPSDIKNIPAHWSQIKLGDIAEQITKGTTPTTAGYQYQESGINFVKVENINQYGIDVSSINQFISEEANQALQRSQLLEGDILFSIAGTIGKTALVTKDCLPANTNQAVAIIRGTSKVFDAKYLRQNFRSSAETIAKINARGGAMNNISLGDLKETAISVPPLAEQQQIAAKLDELLTQVDSIKTRLDAIPNILKRFRQSVLAAAVNGNLTKEFRDKNNFPIWKPTKLHKAANILDPHPSHRTPKEVQGGIPYIGIGDLKEGGSIDFENARKVSRDILLEHQNRYKLDSGDFVFGKIGTLGKATELPINVEYTLSANVILIQPNKEITIPKYLMYFLSSPSTMTDIAKQANSTSQAAFGIKKMREFICEIPSIEEQTEIVTRVEQLFAYADQIEQRVKDAQARINHLTQAILAKAFRGELTADWRAQNSDLISGENSVEALLQRIQIERESHSVMKTRKKSMG